MLLWRAVHLLIAVSVVLLTAGIVLFVRKLSESATENAAALTAVLALVGGTLFVTVIGGIDGAAMAALADSAAGDAGGAIVAAAEAVRAVDPGLLSLVVALHLGATFVALGVLVQRGARPGWIGWTALVTGTAGVVIGASCSCASPTGSPSTRFASWPWGPRWSRWR